MVNAFQWLIVGILVTTIFIFVKLKYLKHKISWIIILFFILLFYIGFLTSTAGQNIDFSTFDGTQTAIKLYMGWMGQSFDNLKVLTGQAVKLDWGSNAEDIKEKLIPAK